VADNKFAVTVTAVDKASAVINKINKEAGKIFRPYDNAKKSVKSFTDAFGRNDFVKRPLWALDKVGKGVTMFGNAFGVAESSVLGGSARIASALGMIGGPIGGLLAGTAAIAGGAAAVSVKMAQMGQDVERTARGLNISTDSLQQYRKAAQLAGLQTETMDSALAALGSNLYGEEAGMNQPLAAALQFANISVKQTKDGAVDTLQALLDIADVVKRMPDQVQARQFTDMLGVTELLPLLRKGREGIEEYLREAKKLGIMSPEQVRQNDEQANAWNRTKTAIDSAAMSVGNLVAKWMNLNEAAEATSRLAERLQKANGVGDTLGTLFKQAASNIWNHGPWSFLGRTIFGEANPDASGMAPEGPRSAAGKVGGAPAGSSPLGLRNNNPGNIRSGNEFARFGSPQAGLTALGKNLVAYQDRHGINTIAGIVNRWAPAADGNNVPAYMADVSRQTGFGINQPLDLHNPAVLAPLISAITKHENGQNPYSPEMIQQAASAAAQGVGERPITVVVQNVPHGMTVKPVRGLGQATVGLTMAPGGMS
jgi:hypothetical protein